MKHFLDRLLHTLLDVSWYKDDSTRLQIGRTILNLLPLVVQKDVDFAYVAHVALSRLSDTSLDVRDMYNRILVLIGGMPMFCNTHARTLPTLDKSYSTHALLRPQQFSHIMSFLAGRSKGEKTASFSGTEWERLRRIHNSYSSEDGMWVHDYLRNVCM